MNYISQQAFLDELEKQGGIVADLALNGATKLMKTRGFQKALGWGSSHHRSMLKLRSLVGTKNPAIRASSMLGKSKAAVGILPEVETSTVGSLNPLRILGNQAQNIEHLVGHVKDTNSVIRGTGRYLKDDLFAARHFTTQQNAGRFNSLNIFRWGKKAKNLKGPQYIFERSTAGKVLGPVATSGVGFGGLAALEKTDKHGRQKSVVRRAGAGASEALKWTVGEPVMAAKMFAYDIPKQILGG